MLRIELCDCRSRTEDPIRHYLLLDPGACVSEALDAALALGVIAEHPERTAAFAGSVGIFSKIVPLNTVLHMGDRLEIYQPLLRDPKEARRDRAQSE